MSTPLTNESITTKLYQTDPSPHEQLIAAIQSRDLKLAATILQSGLDVNAENGLALRTAVEVGGPNLVHLCIHYGAKIFETNGKSSILNFINKRRIITNAQEDHFIFAVLLKNKLIQQAKESLGNHVDFKLVEEPALFETITLKNIIESEKEKSKEIKQKQEAVPTPDLKLANEETSEKKSRTEFSAPENKSDQGGVLNFLFRVFKCGQTQKPQQISSVSEPEPETKSTVEKESKKAKEEPNTAGTEGHISTEDQEKTKTQTQTETQALRCQRMKNVIKRVLLVLDSHLYRDEIEECFCDNGSIKLSRKHFRDEEFYREIAKSDKNRSFIFSKQEQNALIKFLFESNIGLDLPGGDDIKLILKTIWDNSKLKQDYMNWRKHRKDDKRELKDRRDAVRAKLGKLEQDVNHTLDKLIGEFSNYVKDCEESRNTFNGNLNKSEGILETRDFSKKPIKKRKGLLESNILYRRNMNEAFLGVLRAYKKAVKYKNRFVKKYNAWIAEIRAGIRIDAGIEDLDKLEKAELLINKLHRMPQSLTELIRNTKETHGTVIEKRLIAATEQLTDVSYNAKLIIDKETKKSEEDKQAEEQRIRQQKAQDERIKQERILAEKFEIEQKQRRELHEKRAAERRQKYLELQAARLAAKEELKEERERRDSEDSDDSADLDFRKAPKFTFARASQINRYAGLKDALTQLELIIRNPKSNSKIEVFMDSGGIIMALASAMDNIKLMGGKTVFPPALARRFRDREYHNPKLFSDLRWTMVDLQAHNAKIRDMGIKLFAYFNQYQGSKNDIPGNDLSILEAIDSDYLYEVLDIQKRKISDSELKEGSELKSKQESSPKTTQQGSSTNKTYSDIDIVICKAQMLCCHIELCRLNAMEWTHPFLTASKRAKMVMYQPFKPYR